MRLLLSVARSRMCDGAVGLMPLLPLSELWRNRKGLSDPRTRFQCAPFCRRCSMRWNSNACFSLSLSFFSHSPFHFCFTLSIGFLLYPFQRTHTHTHTQKQYIDDCSSRGKAFLFLTTWRKASFSFFFPSFGRPPFFFARVFPLFFVSVVGDVFEGNLQVSKNIRKDAAPRSPSL